MNHAPAAIFYIAGIWRDYARQTGAVVMDRAVWLRLTGDTRTSDLALWPSEGTDVSALQASIRALAAKQTGRQPSTDAGAATGDSGEALVEFSSAATIRASGR